MTLYELLDIVWMRAFLRYCTLHASEKNTDQWEQKKKPVSRMAVTRSHFLSLNRTISYRTVRCHLFGKMERKADSILHKASPTLRGPRNSFQAVHMSLKVDPKLTYTRIKKNPQSFTTKICNSITRSVPLIAVSTGHIFLVAFFEGCVSV